MPPTHRRRIHGRSRGRLSWLGLMLEDAIDHDRQMLPTSETAEQTTIVTVDGLAEESQEQTCAQADGSEVGPSQGLQSQRFVIGLAALDLGYLDHFGL